MLPQLFILERLRRLKAAAPASPDAASANHPALADAHLEQSPRKPVEPWLRRQGRNLAYLVAGVFSAALGLESFILPNGLFDGGVTGLSLLAARFVQLPLSVFLIALNLPFIWLGYQQMGRGFALRALAAILGLALVLVVVPFPVITQDKMLIAVFGGFFLGAGIGLAMRGGGVLDGTEILAVYLTRKLPASIGDIVLIINVIIFGVAAWLLSVETALYSILAYLAAAKTVDFVLVGIEEYIGLTIISFHSPEIRRFITERLHRGATVYEVTQGYGSHGAQHLKVEAVFTVVTRLEVMTLTDAINKIDPRAFVVQHSVSDIKGGLIKKRALH